MNRRSEVRKNETDRNMVSSNRYRYLERKPRRNIAYSGLIRSSKSKANDSITRIVYTKHSRSKENKNQTSKVLVQKLNFDNHSNTERRSMGSSVNAECSKYWKEKAKDYQSENFKLRKVNCALKEQNQILKRKHQMLEKKYEEIKKIAGTKPTLDLSQFQDPYKLQVQEAKQKIAHQQILISKQQHRIKDLSKYAEKNKQLKALLNNFEARLEDLHSDFSPESTERRNSGSTVEKTLKRSPCLNKSNFERYSQMTETQGTFDEIKQNRKFLSSWYDNFAETT